MRDSQVVPEFTSSVILREVLGPSLANEMLLAGRKLPSDLALARGLVSGVFATASEVLAHAHATARDMLMYPLAHKSLPLFKSLVRHEGRIRQLEETFEREMGHLSERTENGDVVEAAVAFLKSKL